MPQEKKWPNYQRGRTNGQTKIRPLMGIDIRRKPYQRSITWYRKRKKIAVEQKILFE
jgi:hypothetical protein